MSPDQTLEVVEESTKEGNSQTNFLDKVVCPGLRILNCFKEGGPGNAGGGVHFKRGVNVVLNLGDVVPTKVIPNCTRP